MKVTLVDHTGFGAADPARHAANVLVFTKSTRLKMSPGLFSEIAAKPWSDIETELQYMANTIPSSWEYINYSFLVTGVSRAYTHQAVRTRTASFAQQTMRVLDVDGWDYATGPTIDKNDDLGVIYDDGMAAIDRIYRELIAGGAKIEDARGILPTNILTNIVIGMNLRTFSETQRKRASTRTQGEYRDVMDAMRAEVIRVHPWAEMFLSRTFDTSAAELEQQLIAALPEGQARTHMIKLIDQMRATA